MDQVLVKTSRKKELFKLISDKKLYEDILFNPSVYVDYDPDHNLDEECWFRIQNFSQKEFCLDFIKGDFSSLEYTQLTKDRFPKIKYIISVQNNYNFFCFQKITSSLFLKKKLIQFFNGCAVLEENEDRLVVHNTPDAIYFKAEDTLIFRDLSIISSIFKGIDTLYREATDIDVKNFLESDFIALNEFQAGNVSKPNRRRIALVKDILDSLDSEGKSRIVSYINEYCFDKLSFDASTGKFEISTDDQLKNLLYGIEERFYTTSIGQEKRLANSIIRL